MSLIFKLPYNDGGFFCQVWKLVSHYLVSKQYNLEFYIDDTEWMFKNRIGWHDYFKSLIPFYKGGTMDGPVHTIIEERFLDQFTLEEYRNAFKEIFQFTDVIQEKLQNTMKELSLSNKEYDAIMIRRGDKMYGESDYISTDTYVNKLLEKDTKLIFVQTDDYGAYEEVCELVKDKNIKPFGDTSLLEFNYAPEVGSTRTEENNEYLKKISTKARAKSVNQYNAYEMREHVEEMLIGLEICLNSRNLVIDYQSNVTRYLVVNHKNNTINIGNEETVSFDVPMRCPRYGFIKN